MIVFICFVFVFLGQPFPVFAQDQGNPQQPNIPAQQQTSRHQATTQLSQQFLQNNQPPGGGTADILAGSNTRTQQVRTVTVPVLPAPAGLTAQLGQQLQPQDVGPIPRFAPQNGPIGRQFTRFGPGQLGAMSAARRRQMAMMQQQVAQQANMVQPGRRFQGLGENGQMLIISNNAARNIRAGRTVGSRNLFSTLRTNRPASLLTTFALQPGITSRRITLLNNGRPGNEATTRQNTRTTVTSEVITTNNEVGTQNDGVNVIRTSTNGFRGGTPANRRLNVQRTTNRITGIANKMYFCF